MSVLLAYVMLISPVMLQSLAQGATAYSEISTLAWGQNGDAFTYYYDANGSTEYKLYDAFDPAADPAVIISTNPTLPYDHYEYNLQNRLKKVTSFDGSTPTWTQYAYNDAGIRVKAEHSDTTVEIFLIDSYNHTGYAQVLEEKDDSSAVTKTYTIGDDVIAQYNTTDGTEYLLYDGHGSTRQLTDSAGAVIDSYSYDGYGVMLGADDTAAASADTSLLYAGEQYDSALSQYYLRARYYNPSNGRFNRVDPFAGDMQDPQSLHKYLYAHCNPINALDPTGEFLDFTLVGLLRNMTISTLMESFVMPKLAPYAEKAATLFVPSWLRQAISGDTPSAYLIGGSGSVSAGWGLGVGLLGGAELLYASGSNKYVAYTYTGLTGGIMSGRGGAVTVGGYVGAIWGAKSSLDYAGRSTGVSFPFGHFATGLRRTVATKIRRRIHQVFDAPPEYKLINAANEAAAGRIANALGPYGNFEASFFWNDSQTVGGVLLGAELNIGKGFMISAFSTKYKQVWPEQEVPFF